MELYFISTMLETHDLHPLLQTHAEVTLAKTDLALREKEAELARLSAEQQALRAELAAVKEGLSTSTERAEKLQEEGQVRPSTHYCFISLFMEGPRELRRLLEFVSKLILMHVLMLMTTTKTVDRQDEYLMSILNE